MQKLIVQSQNSHTGSSSEQYVVRIGVQNDCFVARYFEAEDAPVAAEVVDGVEVINPVAPSNTLTAFDPNSTALLRLFPDDLDRFTPEAVTQSGAFSGKVFKEVGRQIVRPLASAAYGAGEKGDFTAIVLSINNDGLVQEPFSHFAESIGVRGSVLRSARHRDSLPLFVLYSSDATANIGSFTVMRFNAPGFVIEDSTDGEWTNAPAGTTVYSLLPTVSMSCASVPADGTATVNVTVSGSYSGEMVVEPVAGYVPNTRVSVNNGSGSFKLMGLGLASGESARVKIGSKQITGLADLVIPVV